MYTKWRYYYKGNSIVVTKSWFGRAKLYINDELVDKKFRPAFCNLYGRLKDNSYVEANVEPHLFLYKCHLNIDGDRFDLQVADGAGW